MKAHGGRGGIAPFILNIDSRNTFTLLLLDTFERGMEPRYAVNRRLGWPQSRSEHYELEKNLKNKRRTWCHLLFYFTSYVLNMFRTLIYPSSGACDCAVQLPLRSFCSRFVVCWRFGAAGFEWCPCCRLQPATRTHQVGLLFFNYYNDARSNKHKIEKNLLPAPRIEPQVLPVAC